MKAHPKKNGFNVMSNDIEFIFVFCISKKILNDHNTSILVEIISEINLNKKINKNNNNSTLKI